MTVVGASRRGDGRRRWSIGRKEQWFSKREATIKDAREVDVVGSTETTVSSVLKSAGFSTFP
jgi:hypothetical protein